MKRQGDFVATGWCFPLLPVLFLVGCLGCGDSTEDNTPQYYSVFGTLTSTSVDASGHKAYLQLSSLEDVGSQAVSYQADAVFSGPSCSYQFVGVLAGSYEMIAFVDLNNNSSIQQPSSDTGDLLAQNKSVLLYSSQQIDYNDNDWHRIP
jgi:hypothetical protein